MLWTDATGGYWFWCLLCAALICIVTEEIAVIEGIQFLKGNSDDRED